MIERFTRGGFVVSTDPKRLDFKAAHAYLESSYWGKGRPFSRLKKAMRNSLCFGLYRGREMVGLARVTTDYSGFAYLGDVYVRPELQGKGLGKWLVSCVLRSRAVKGVRTWYLKTKDAHGLYRRYGFGPVKDPERWMQFTRETARR